MINETCSCGAAIEVNRDDELKLIREWRRTHKCQPPREFQGELASITHIADKEPIPERQLGFIPEEKKRND